MSYKKQKSFGSNIGSLSLVVVFSILSLTVFAILAYVSANSEYKLAKKFGQSVENLYAADYKAYETLEKIKLGMETSETFTIDEYGRVFLFVPVDEYRRLNVSALILGEEIDIISWNTENTSTQAFDESLPVWTGNEGVLQ